jgi:hypothetical protein
MKTRFLAISVALGITSLARAADFTPIALDPSSYNQDPVIEAAAPRTFNETVSVTLDGGTNKTGNTWYEVGYMTNSTGLAAHNSLITTNNHTWQMPPDYHTNCVFFVGHHQSTWSPVVGPATATLTTPAQYSFLSFLSGSGNGPCLVHYTIHYQGGATEEGTFTSYDWFDNTAAGHTAKAFDAFGLISLNGAVNNQSTNHGELFRADVPVGQPSVNITSVDFAWYGNGTGQNPWSNGRTAIYAIAGSTDGTTYSPIAVSGYNYDNVVEADAPQTAGAAAQSITGTLTNVNTWCTFTMDGGTSKANWTWMERGYYTFCPQAGLPVAGSTITSLTQPTIHYTMPSTYVGNCAVCLASNVPTANVKFATPAAYGGISFLAGGGNNGTPLNIRTETQFQDGTVETNWIQMVDWFNRTDPYAYVSFGQTIPGSRAIRNGPDQFPNYFLPGWLPPFARDPRNGGAAFPNVPNIRLYDVQFVVTNSSGLITNIALVTTNVGAWTQTASILAVAGNGGAAASITQPIALVTDSATGFTNRYSTNGNAFAAANLITNTAIANDINFTKAWQGTNNVTLYVSNRLGNAVSYQWKRAPLGGGWRDIYLSFDLSTFANVTGPNIAGATSNVLTISNATLADTGDYVVVASNPYGSYTSFVASVLIMNTNGSVLIGQANGDVITKYTFDTDSATAAEFFGAASDQVAQKWLSRGTGTNGFGGQPIPFGTVPFAGPAGYIVTPVSGASFVNTIRFYCANDSAGRDPRDYSLEGSNDGGGTWTPITSGQLLGTLMLPVGRGGTGAAALNPTANPLMEVNFANANSYKSYRITITNNIEPFATPLMQIAEIQLLGTFVPAPPTWVRQPEPGVTAYVGTSPSFAAKASGLGALAPKYLWFRGASAIAGATSSSYTLANAQLTDSGATFFCVATNNFGAITSSIGTLTVIAAPTQTYPAAVLANAPKAYWRLDEPDNASGNNGVVAHDYAGGHNGYYSNTVNGVSGYSPAFDPDTAMQAGPANDSFVAGINDVDFARAANSPGAAFSVEAWAFGGNQTVDAAVVAKGYNGILNTGIGTGTEQYAIDVTTANPRKFRFLVRGASGQGYQAQSTIVPYDSVTLQATWHHLVGVCDQPNGSMYLYVDGLLAATSSIPSNAGILAQSLPTTIGSRPSSPTADYDNQWNGTIDDVAIYGSALSAGQVQAHYNAGDRPPIITLQPTNQTTPENVTVTFYTSSYGAGTLGYQWYLSDGFNPTAPVVGQTSPNLSFNTSVSQSGNNYQLVVSNPYGSTTSAVAQLTVQGGLPFFATDLPSSQTYLIGHVIQLQVNVLGTAPFTYQWKKDGVNLNDDFRTSGTHTNLLTIGYATNADSGTYQCFVSNGQGTTPSTADAILVTNVGGNLVVPFNSARNGWQYQLTGDAAGQAGMSNGAVTMTLNAFGNSQSSCFLSNKIDITSFTAQFVYTLAAGAGAGADGIVFCIQNDTRGVTALGGGGGSLGYSGITPSVGLEMNIYNPNTRGISFQQNGTIPAAGAGGFSPILPVDLGNTANPIQVNIIYSGNTLNASFKDLVTSATFSTNFTINIPTVIGANQAYVGFTGADGGVNSTQVISNFTMSPPAVKINSGLVGNSLVLTWPSSSGAFLKTTSVLGNPSVWTLATSPFTVVSNQAHVVVSPLLGNQFYRLEIYP